MKQKVKVRNCTFDDRNVKICVPIVAQDMNDALIQCQKANLLPCDVIEIRMDYFLHLDDPYLQETFQQIRGTISDKVLLATFRSIEEGGSKVCDDHSYEHIYTFLMEQQLCDMIDLEFSKKDVLLQRLQKLAKEHNVVTILSSHDFEKTKSSSALMQQILDMADTPMDIIKLAVMPKSEEDVVRFMDVASTMDKKLSQPMIMMAMDELGKRTRIECESFGSCLTFASADKTSAPGQMPCKEVRKLLDEYHVMKMHSDS